MAQDENLSASEGSSSILHNTPATHTVRRSRKRKRKRGIDPAAVKPICYRIRGIPINTPKDELQSHLAKSAKKPEADLILTLALSHGKWLTATTGLLHATPKFTPSYEVDSNFFGITPLSGREDAVVEYVIIISRFVATANWRQHHCHPWFRKPCYRRLQSQNRKQCLASRLPPGRYPYRSCLDLRIRYHDHRAELEVLHHRLGQGLSRLIQNVPGSHADESKINHLYWSQPRRSSYQGGILVDLCIVCHGN